LGANKHFLSFPKKEPVLRKKKKKIMEVKERPRKENFLV